MKTLLLFPLLFLSLISTPCLSETMDELVKRDGIYYKKFTEAPFTGKVTGKVQGSYKNGSREGDWVHYHSNGQLKGKGSYKNGKLEGEWVHYHYNGQLAIKGSFKNGKEEGNWVSYKGDGTVNKQWTGTFKNGEKVSKNLGGNEEFFNWFFTQKSKYPKFNNHQLFSSKNFSSFIKRNLNSKKTFYLGMTKGEEETLFYHLHEVLTSGTDSDREVGVKNGVLNISGCRYRSCEEKGLVWIDTRSNKEIFVILHYFYNYSEYQPKGDLLVFSNDYDSARELPKRFRIDLLNWKKRHKLNNEIRVRFHTTE